MKFSQDWFSHNIPNFEFIKTILPKRMSVLEIGCFEGKASCWMLENFLDDEGSLVCIDTFKGSAEHANLELGDLYATWKENTDWVRKTTQDTVAYHGTSYDMLASLIYAQDRFDFIYIDGSHTAPDVLTDACMAFGLLKSGGVMLFDDYLWNDMPGLKNRPKIAVDAFTAIFADKASIVMIGYQLAIIKH